MRVAVMSDMVRANGAGVMTLLAADLLADAGHDVIVVAGAMSDDLERSLDVRFFSAHAFTHDERALDGSVTDTDHQAFRRGFRRWLDTVLDDSQIDVVCVHNCGRILHQLELARLSRVIPVAHTMHDEWFYTDAHYTYTSVTGETIRTYEPGRAERLLEHRYDHLFAVPSQVGTFLGIGPSRWLTKRAMRVFPTVDIAHVPNPVDSELFALQDRAACRASLGLPADSPIALFVGSPTQPRKGFRQFEAALQTIEQPIIRLVAGGPGSVAVGGVEELLGEGPIRELIDAPTSDPVGQLGVRGPGLVISGLARQYMPLVYGAADVLVHPSRIDNLPTVPIEAGLCGTRCLASDVGGTAETIADGRDLFPVDSSPDALGTRIAAAIEAASTETIEDREARRQRQLERFSADAHAAQLLPLLESLAARGDGR